MPKTGRPRGVNINPAAVRDLLLIKRIPQRALCAAVEISPPHLSEAMKGKGIALTTIEKIARVLGVDPSTIAPELADGDIRFRAVRTDDGAAA